MTTLTADLELELEVREATADGFLSTLTGRAIPYGPTATVDGTKLGVRGRVTESFARESFDPADVQGKPLAWRHGEPIGVITRAWNQEDGLYIEAGILDTTAGRDANLLLRSGAVRGLSPGFRSLQRIWNKTKTAVQHVKNTALEISLTHQPAYATAGVGDVREEDTMPGTDVVDDDTEVIDAQAREQLGSIHTMLADIQASIDAGGSDPVHPLAQFRDAKEYLTAVVAGEVEERTLNVSALSEQTGMVPPTWLQDVKGVLDRGRPCINAIGGPSSAGDAGLDIKWPTFDGVLSGAVGTTGGVDGTEVTSTDLDIVAGSATIAQFSGANRLPYLVIERAAPSYLQAYMRIMAGSFNYKTDLAFQTALWANDTSSGIDYVHGSDADGLEFVAAVWAAATAVDDATGLPADVVYVAPHIWLKLPRWAKFQEQNNPVQNVAGTISIKGLSANIGGLPIVRAKGFATDGSQDVIVTNDMAIKWAEDGPRYAQAEQPGSTSRDIAIYGYGTATPFIPAGIVSIYNTP